MWRTLCSCDRSGRGDESPEGSTASRAYLRAAYHTPERGEEKRDADKDRNAHTGSEVRHQRTSEDQFLCTAALVWVTHLTVVALEVIVLVHRHDPEDLFTALRHRTGKYFNNSERFFILSLALLSKKKKK